MDRPKLTFLTISSLWHTLYDMKLIAKFWWSSAWDREKRINFNTEMTYSTFIPFMSVWVKACAYILNQWRSINKCKVQVWTGKGENPVVQTTCRRHQLLIRKIKIHIFELGAFLTEGKGPAVNTNTVLVGKKVKADFSPHALRCFQSENFVLTRLFQIKNPTKMGFTWCRKLQKYSHSIEVYFFQWFEVTAVEIFLVSGLSSSHNTRSENGRALLLGTHTI